MAETRTQAGAQMTLIVLTQAVGYTGQKGGE
jgi:hypothetical protein